MDILKVVGGARIGTANTSWPFAVLTVTKEKLELNASVIGNCSFTKNDIIAIEPFSGIISRGIKIIHKVPGYKKHIVFWTWKRPEDLINSMQEIGFLDGNYNSISIEAESYEIVGRQSQGAFPIKSSAAVSIIIIWNILFFVDLIRLIKKIKSNDLTGIPLDKGAFAAFGFVFIVAILTMISHGFRKLVLKPGRTLLDVKRFLYMIILICTIVLFALSFQVF